MHELREHMSVVAETRLACVYIIRHPNLTARYDPDDKSTGGLVLFPFWPVRQESTGWAFHTGAAISKHVPASNAEVINKK